MTLDSYLQQLDALHASAQSAALSECISPSGHKQVRKLNDHQTDNVLEVSL